MADEQETKHMPPRTAAGEERAIDRLTESLTGFRVEIAGAMGAIKEQLVQYGKRLDAVDGLSVRVAVLEKDSALHKQELTDYKSTILGWKGDSDKEKSGLRDDLDAVTARVTTLDNYKWFLLGGVAVLQVLIGIFGPSLRTMLGLP